MYALLRNYYATVVLQDEVKLIIEEERECDIFYDNNRSQHLRSTAVCTTPQSLCLVAGRGKKIEGEKRYFEVPGIVVRPRG